MNIQLQKLKSPDQFRRPRNLASDRSAPWWRSALAVLRSRLSLQMLAVGAAIGLVLIFHAVVKQAVRDSGLRKQALAAQSQAVWRCKLLPSASARQACLQELPTLSGSSR